MDIPYYFRSFCMDKILTSSLKQKKLWNYFDHLRVLIKRNPVLPNCLENSKHEFLYDWRTNTCNWLKLLKIIHYPHDKNVWTYCQFHIFFRQNHVDIHRWCWWSRWDQMKASDKLLHLNNEFYNLDLIIPNLEYMKWNFRTCMIRKPLIPLQE